MIHYLYSVLCFKNYDQVMQTSSNIMQYQYTQYRAMLSQKLQISQFI